MIAISLPASGIDFDRKAKLGGFLSWLACFVLICTTAPFGLSIYDEGSLLTGAMNTLAGRFPTVDFWTIYPGGAYVWIALLFKLTGEQMIALRIVVAAVMSLGPALCFLLTYRSSSIIAAIAAAAAMTFWIAGTQPNFGYPPPMLIMLGSVILLAVLSAHRSPPVLALYGSALGGLALLRLDFGAFAWLRTAVGLLSVRCVSFRRRILDVFAFGFGAGTVLLAGIIVYWACRGSASLLLLFDRILQFPAGKFHAARDLPFPVPFAAMLHGDAPPTVALIGESLALSLYYLVMVGLPIALLVSIRNVRRPYTGQNHATAAAQLALTLFATLTVAPFLGRSHFVQGWPFATLGLIALLWTPRIRVVTELLYAVALVAGGMETARKLDYSYGQPSVPLESPHAVGIRLQARQAWYNDVLRVARSAHLIYSAPPTHQHVNANDTLLYFLLGQLPPTAFYEVHPLVTDSAMVQAAILADFQRNRPDLVVVFDDLAKEPNLSSAGTGVTLVDETITEHCNETQRIRTYTFLKCHWD